MVAHNIRLPNVRKMFVPDPGHIIVDADLSGADAQVVAWEADDEDLKSAFRAGVKIHLHNARTMFPHQVKDMTDDEIKARPIYKDVKMGCHACNYGASEDALVANIGWDRKFAFEFKARWFSAHPKILEWHQRYERYLLGTQCWNCDNLDITIGRPCNQCGVHLGRTIKNAFGFRMMYFDRVDGQILPQALAWTPQSSVIFASDLGWVNIVEGHQAAMQFSHAEAVVQNWGKWLVCPNAKEKWDNIFQPLIQVHDSIVFQIPEAYEEDIPQIVNDMLVRIPYPDPLVIPMGYKSSHKSWGECK